MKKAKDTFSSAVDLHPVKTQRTHLCGTESTITSFYFDPDIAVLKMQQSEDGKWHIISTTGKDGKIVTITAVKEKLSRDKGHGDAAIQGYRESLRAQTDKPKGLFRRV